MERGWPRALVLIAALLGVDAAGQGADAPAPATLRWWNRDIVVFRVRVGALDPAARAARSAERIDGLGADARLDAVSIDPAKVDGITGVIVSEAGRPLFGLAEGDLDPEDEQTPRQAAEKAVEQLRDAFAARAEQRQGSVIVLGIAQALGAAAALAIILALMSLAARRVNARLKRLHLHGVHPVGGVDLRPAARNLIRSAIALPLWCARLGSAYLALSVALAGFPFTQPWAERLAAALLHLLGDLAQGSVQALPGMLMVAATLYGARLATRALGAFFTSVEVGAVTVPWLHPETVHATRRIVVALIWVLALALSYPRLPGSDRPAFQIISVIAGLLVTLSSRGVVDEAMCGLAVIYSRALRVGDVVRVGDLVGVVTEMGVFATKLRTFVEEEVTVPNATLVEEKVTNYSRLAVPDGGMIVVIVGIGYGVPWRQVQAMLLLAAARTARVRREPPPQALQRALTDVSVEYELRCRIADPRERCEALSDLHGRIQDVFYEHGVQIMTPRFEEQPHAPLVVPPERWHERPAAPEP
jgi:small-conductance mechanosensitive channel